MKVYVSKSLKAIHWGTYLAAFFCFFTTYVTFNDYRETKYLFEKGSVEKAIVTKLPENCYGSGRSKIYMDVQIISTGRDTDLQINEEICDTTNLNDTLLIRCTNGFESILRYDASITKASKKDLYFSIFSLCLGIVILLFGNTKNNYLNGY
jgi:hypothetical protein